MYSAGDPKIAKIYSRVKKVVVNVFQESEEKITLETNYIADLGADSLILLTLIMELEDEFEINIPYEEAKEFMTIGTTVGYVAKKMINNPLLKDSEVC